MIQCPSCQQSIAENAYNCIHCGHKLRSTPTNIFFKIALGCLGLIVILIILAFMFSAFTSWFFFGGTSSSRPINTNANVVEVTPKQNTNLKRR